MANIDYSHVEAIARARSDYSSVEAIKDFDKFKHIQGLGPFVLDHLKTGLIKKDGSIEELIKNYRINSGVKNKSSRKIIEDYLDDKAARSLEESLKEADDLEYELMGSIRLTPEQLSMRIGGVRSDRPLPSFKPSKYKNRKPKSKVRKPKYFGGIRP